MSAAVRHRLFFALRPPPGIASEIERLSRLGRGRRVRREHFHLTLAITGDYAEPPIGVADKLMRLAEELYLASFPLKLDQLVGSPRSLALRPKDKSPPLALLQRQLERGLLRAGLRRTGWRFNPHLTLLYRQGLVFSRPIVPITWQAAELVLVHSHAGLTRHDVLGRWPLLPLLHSGLAA